MIYVYNAGKSQSASDLAKTLDGHRLRHFDGLDFWNRSKRYVFSPADMIVCYGSRVHDLDGVRVINHGKALTTFRALQYLSSRGIPTVRIADYNYENGIIPRLNAGGGDLLNPPAKEKAEYWVRTEQFTSVYRIHSFAGRSIRAGEKQPREGFRKVGLNLWKPDSRLAHHWIWTWETGWKVHYDGFKSTKEVRELAHKTLKFLGLTFGAVDIGERADKHLMVIKVDLAPVLEGRTLDIYARNILKWFKNEENPELTPASVQDEGNEEILQVEEPLLRDRSLRTYTEGLRERSAAATRDRRNTLINAQRYALPTAPAEAPNPFPEAVEYDPEPLQDYWESAVNEDDDPEPEED